jgi:flagellar basal-body rod modification protein FlgD
MPVDSIQGSGAATQNAFSQASRLGQEEFLKLLVTQMTNQDPLNPMDQEQMLAQLAQFSTVEGVNNIKNSQTRMQASAMLGRNIDAFVFQDNKPELLTGRVTSVRWDNQGIFLTIEGSDHEISLDDVSGVH